MKLDVYEVGCMSLIPHTFIVSEDDFSQIEFSLDDDTAFYIRVHESCEDDDDGYEYVVWIDERMPGKNFWHDSYLGYSSTLLGAWKIIYETIL